MSIVLNRNPSLEILVLRALELGQERQQLSSAYPDPDPALYEISSDKEQQTVTGS